MPITYIPYVPDTVEGQAILDNITRTRRMLRYRDNGKSFERIRHGLPLSASLVAALHTHRARQLELKLWAGSSRQEYGLVFCTKHGKPFAPRNMLDDWRILLKRAELPRMRFHDLRHSFATLLRNQKVPVKVVQELLGHSGPRVTLGIYQHVATDDRAAAVAQLEAWLNPHEKTA